MKKEKIIRTSIIGTFIMTIFLGGYWTIKKEQINIVVQGKEITVSTFKSKVKDLLDQSNIIYDEDDIIKPSLDSKLVDNMDIEVVKVDKTNQREYENINYDIETIEDENIEKGSNEIHQKGINGEKERVYELTYYDGELVSKELIKEGIYKDPINEIVKKGTKEDSTYMSVVATAYAGDGITATGTVPKWGTIAVDPRIIPYGTKVYIPKFDMTFIAEDCGGAIKGNKIDIFMNSENQAYDWGRRTIDIYVMN